MTKLTKYCAAFSGGLEALLPSSEVKEDESQDEEQEDDEQLEEEDKEEKEEKEADNGDDEEKEEKEAEEEGRAEEEKKAREKLITLRLMRRAEALKDSWAKMQEDDEETPRAPFKILEGNFGPCSSRPPADATTMAEDGSARRSRAQVGGS